ncbi:MAG: hypothetical protein HDS18_02270 [Bacteroides sp.]|nr:hypothetical protein [Bacteroides sp.]
MRRTLLYAIFTLILICAGTGCDRKGRDLDSKMDKADELMMDHPDSALKIMQSIDTAGLSQAHIARYALLLTKAEDKNNLNPTNDSLIKISLDYYCGRENREELESVFFCSLVFYYEDSLKQSLPYATLAYEIAKDRNDAFYEGMSARLLSDIYKLLYIFPDQKKYAVLSRDAFLRYEKESGTDNRYSSWMGYMTAAAMYTNKEYQECINVCDAIDEVAINKNSRLRHLLWIAKADAYNKLRKPEHSIEIYDSLRADGYVMEGCNWGRLSLYYYNVGDYAKSQEALDSTKCNITYGQDTLYIAKMEYLLARRKQSHNAFVKLEAYNDAVINASNEAILNSPLHNVMDSYQKRSEDYKQKLKGQKSVLWLSCTGLMVVIMLIIYVAHKYIRSKRRENSVLEQLNSNLEQVNADLSVENISLKDQMNFVEELNADLRKRMADLSKQYESLSNQLSANDLKQDELDNKDLLKMIKYNLNKLDEYCKALYFVTEKEKNASSFIKSEIDSLLSDKSLSNIDLSIDLYSKGFIHIFQINFPKIRISRLRLVRYLFAGFSLETIMILQQAESRKKIDTAKWDLKRRIIEKEDWTQISKSTVLRKLNFG